MPSLTPCLCLWYWLRISLCLMLLLLLLLMWFLHLFLWLFQWCSLSSVFRGTFQTLFKGCCSDVNFTWSGILLYYLHDAKRTSLSPRVDFSPSFFSGWQLLWQSLFAFICILFYFFKKSYSKSCHAKFFFLGWDHLQNMCSRLASGIFHCVTHNCSFARNRMIH